MSELRVSEQCNESLDVELEWELVIVRCTLSKGHDEAHRAVIFWPANRDLVSIDEVWEAST